MITPSYVRTMAAYNSEMNRRLYAAASRLSDDERRRDRGAFWHSLHGTLVHILWGDGQWMSRFDGWERPQTPIKESDHMLAGWDELHAARVEADRKIDAWAGKVDQAYLDRDMTWFSGAAQREVTAPIRAPGHAFLQSPNPSPWASARADHRRRRENRRYRPVSRDPADDRLRLSISRAAPPQCVDAPGRAVGAAASVPESPRPWR